MFLNFPSDIFLFWLALLSCWLLFPQNSPNNREKEVLNLIKATEAILDFKILEKIPKQVSARFQAGMK